MRNGLDANCKRFIRERPVHWGWLVSHTGVEESMTPSSRSKGFIKAKTANTWHPGTMGQVLLPAISEVYFGHRSRGLNNFSLSLRIFQSPLFLVNSSNLRTRHSFLTHMEKQKHNTRAFPLNLKVFCAVVSNVERISILEAVWGFQVSFQSSIYN